MPDTLDEDLARVLSGVLGVDVERVWMLERGTEPWDSLRHIELVFTAEDTFGVQLTGDEVAAATSARTLANIIRSHRGS
jgi:acyl carrier protein